MNDHKKSLEQLEKQVDRLETIQKVQGAVSSKSESKFKLELSANAPGIWIAAICAAACLSAVYVSQISNSRDFARIEAELKELRLSDKRHDDYLNAIYQQAPQLKKQDKKE